MWVRTITIIKFMCAIFVLYYTWLSVIIPSLAGYLLPIGVLMMGMIFFYMLDNSIVINNVIDFPIGCWLIFSIVEYIVASFVAVNVSFAHRSVITFLELVIMCFAMIFVAKEEGNIDFLIKLIYVTCTAYVISMLIINNYISGRLALVNANGDANVCLIGIVVATLIIDHEKILQPLFVIGTMCLMFYANIMTGSRKSYICMIFYLALWLVVFFKTNWKQMSAKKKIVILFLIIIATFLVVQYVVPIIMNSTTMSRMLAGSKEGDELRLGLYKEALEHFKRSPIVGIGYNQFRIYNSAGYYSHSTYAEIFADGGIVGAVLFFAPHVWCVVNLIKIAKKSKGYDLDEMRNALLLLVYMVSSLFLAAGMVQMSNERVLMMYAVMFAYIICYKQKERGDYFAQYKNNY
jgi:O-antigen ligase